MLQKGNFSLGHYPETIKTDQIDDYDNINANIQKWQFPP